jgi:hypothetical protein
MTKIQTANAWASTDDDFKHQYKWYNKSMLKISNFLLFAYHIWGIYSWVANKSSYENSLEQSSFFGVKYIVLLVPILKTIALINIMTRILIKLFEHDNVHWCVLKRVKFTQ